MSADRNAAIEREYRGGDTAKQIATRYGITYQRVYMILRERDVPKDARPTITQQLEACRALRLREGNRYAAQLDAATRERDMWRAKAEEYVHGEVVLLPGERDVLCLNFRVDRALAKHARSIDGLLADTFSRVAAEFHRAVGR